MKRMTVTICLAASMVAFSAGVYAEALGEQRYEIVKASEDRVWRLDRRTGEIAVCSLTGEQLLCTSSEAAIVPPVMSYADLQRQRDEEDRLLAERRLEKQKRRQVVLDMMLGAIKNLAVVAPEVE